MKNLSTSVSSTRCLWSKMPPSSRKGYVWTWDRWIPKWNFDHSLPGHWLDAWQFQADLISTGASCSDLREHRQSWRRPGCPHAGEKRRRCLPSLWKKDTTMLEVFGSHLKVPPPGDGLWGEGWVEGGGEEGDHLHHRPGSSDCKTHLMLILWFLVKLHVLSFQSFHSAGDGKLGGLTLPNDGRCHLNTTGFYDWSTVQVVLHLGTSKPEQ